MSNRNLTCRTIALTACAALSSLALAAGPDVIVFDLYDIESWGSSGGIEAYSIGTNSCNIGDENLLWQSWDNQRPVIGQNLYRYKDGRIEQVGQSWLKWGFAALNLDDCNTCNDPGTQSALGPGCSDPYSAGLNGSANSLGPKSIVNPFTGDFPASHATPSGASTIRGRVQVHQDDVNPALNPGARYFIEGQYIHPDDAGAGNDYNNASHREVWITGGNALTFNNPAGGTSNTRRQAPAITVWTGLDQNVDPHIVDIPGEGRLYMSWAATDLGGGMWNYEIAVFNLNSDRAVGSVTCTMGAAATFANIGFHDVDYHSGEPYSLADWTPSTTGTTISWATEDYATNPNANALRWGTLYNFRFDCDLPPAALLQVEMGLFKPGSPSSVVVTLSDPGDNDNCWAAAGIGPGVEPFDTTSATTDGPSETSFCSNGAMEADIWYLYSATCDSDVTVSLCGSTFNTVLAVYDASCPVASGSALACDDDACSLQSETTFAATSGTDYLIRIAGYNGDTGTGSMAVSAELGVARGDINGDNVVDLADLAELLANYGDGSPVAGDLDNDGDVDLTDLAQLLANYGSNCN